MSHCSDYLVLDVWLVSAVLLSQVDMAACSEDIHVTDRWLTGELWRRAVEDLYAIPEFDTMAERLKYIGVDSHEIETPCGTILLIVDSNMPLDQVRFL